LSPTSPIYCYCKKKKKSNPIPNSIYTESIKNKKNYIAATIISGKKLLFENTVEIVFLKKLIFLFNYFFNQKFECGENVKMNFFILLNYFNVMI
jgi:hypothetical protein